MTFEEYMQNKYPNEFESSDDTLNDSDLLEAYRAGFAEAFRQYVPSPFPGVN